MEEFRGGNILVVGLISIFENDPNVYQSLQECKRRQAIKRVHKTR